MMFSAERSREGIDCVFAAQVGCSFRESGIMSEMLDYESVIRVLLHHGCELNGILNLLLNNAMHSYPDLIVTSEKELDFTGELDFEEEADAEGEVDVGAKLDSKRKDDIINHANPRRKFTMKRALNTLLHYLSFLFDQGFEVNDIDDTGFTLLMNLILAITDPHSNSPFNRGGTLVVLALCLLKADVSIREPIFGLQALHMLFYAGRDVVGTSYFSDLAYVLIRYGGADVHATTYDGASPLLYAYGNGWQDEWFTVLRRCRISISEYWTKERQCLDRFRNLGKGDSTAIDTNDLLCNDSETFTKRKPFTGDRLGE